ncbi:MAG: tRNA uridine-5-carboxymethylaminomethyl(34) synthesis enzyme MnmG [Bacteroidales bacterium]|nr:tRNA uridine-5-carboxymethylaminomethyl(34) synthesis enzyme MnmG [Bacteroidales bacterium]
MLLERYDIVVVGGGHAGCEAAAAAGRLGSRVLLISHNLNGLAQMSCNPAMGGIAKGQIIREIDALGGLSAIVTDHTMIQFRMLNRSKGPAMWSPRAQSDRMLFSQKWAGLIEGIENVHLWQDNVNGVLVRNGVVEGVTADIAGNIYAQAAIITSGTFLNGIIHIGKSALKGGRLGEKSASGLTQSINSLGIASERLKTGTPVRVDRRTVDLSVMTEQKGDEPPGRFSFMETPPLKDQMSCYLCYTSEEVHEILRRGFQDSPMFAGRIQGTGPRYCPSIEDKIERFSERERHQLFIEPDGRSSVELYINGFSSSLPIEIQYEALRRINGFEKARILKPGYAIEYDYFPPQQLRYSLESRVVENLYFAGQVNGTTGYEEAAAQGLMAGINATRKINGQEAVVLNRSEAYIGVLIDDLVTKGTEEPYRMFTSRAEYRILLRQDNADQRLTPLGYNLGLADSARFMRLKNKQEVINRIKQVLDSGNAEPSVVNAYLEQSGTNPVASKTRYSRLLLRPQVKLAELMDADPMLKEMILWGDQDMFMDECIESAELELKYSGYIEKEKELAEKISRLENREIPPDIDYMNIPAISLEAREKLRRVRPATIGQASRISGISPSDISILLVFLGK